MSLYIDASAFMKRYVPTEAGHAECVELMERDEIWTTSAITEIETARGIARMVEGDSAELLAQFDHDLSESGVVPVDGGVVALARSIAIRTGLKSLDAIHVASAQRCGDDDLQFLTYDDRQAAAAEAVGLRLAR